MRELIRENRPFFVSYGCLLLLVGVLQLVYDPTQLILFINTHYTPQTDLFFKYLTYVGDGLFYVAIILVLLFVQYRYALVALLSFVLTSLVAQLLKRLVFTDYYRPWRFYEHSTTVKLRLIEGVQMYSNNSFPSGHATTVFSIACLLALIVRQKKWSYLFLMMACLTAYSRVYLSEHFVRDVYAGSLIGVFLTLLMMSWLLQYVDKNPKEWHGASLTFRKRRRFPENRSGN